MKLFAVPKVNFEVYAPGFLSRFFESHAVMIQGNAGLKPKEGEVTSQPWQWPINYRGQFFSGSAYRIYLLGNPIIWWSNLVFIAIFLVLFIISAIRHERGYEDFTNPDSESKWRSLRAGAWLFGGWLLHYLPFWAMGRVLYFHHYFPALIFNSMLTAKNCGLYGEEEERSFLEENGQTPNAPVAVYCATENFLPKRKFVGVNKGNYSL
uniref:Protein O-mannosyl-transferase C-terminal four TM domain-containing protein n=1 Tax=Phlebotomus papatasi TaxID=29031 RepID=A0A1B0GQC3_PHLPP